MGIKARTLGIAALAIMAVGGYFIASKLNRTGAAGDSGVRPDSDSQSARMESVPAPRVSGELMQLPESQSIAIAPAPQGKSQTADSPNVD